MEFDDDDDDDDRTTMAATASYCDPMTGWLHTEMVVGIDDCATSKDDDAAISWTQQVTYHGTKCLNLGGGQSVIFECLLGSCPGARTTTTTNDERNNQNKDENGNDEAVGPIMMGQRRRRRGLRLADPAPPAARALTVRLMMHRGRSLAHND